jgi:hypothetical protein
MSLFKCQKCGCIENTALGRYWGAKEKLCSECATGKWHNAFPKEKYDPKKWKKTEWSDEFLERIK